MNTNRPDPRSFFAFLCLAIELTDAAIHDAGGLIATGRFSAEGIAAIDDFRREHAAAIRESLRGGLGERARADGASVDMLAHPAMANLISEYAELLFAALPRPADMAPRVDEFKPRRSTVTRACLGAYIVTGGKSRAAAAAFLNRIPPRDEGAFVEDEQVRDALDRFARDIIRASNSSASIDWHVLVSVHHARVAAALWTDLHASRGVNRIDVYVSALVQNGEFFRRWAGAAEADFANPIDARRLGVIVLELQIAYLQKLQARRDKIELGTKAPAGNALTSSRG